MTSTCKEKLRIIREICTFSNVDYDNGVDDSIVEIIDAADVDEYLEQNGNEVGLQYTSIFWNKNTRSFFSRRALTKEHLKQWTNAEIDWDGQQFVDMPENKGDENDLH